MRYLSLLMLITAVAGCGRKIDTNEPPPIAAPTLVMPPEPAGPTEQPAAEPEPEPEPEPEAAEEAGPAPLAEIDDPATLAVETARRALLGARDAVAGKHYAALAEHCEVALDSLRRAQGVVPAGDRAAIDELIRALDRLPGTPAEVDALLARLPGAPAPVIGNEAVDAPL